jgi:hemerythrin superfamily protein
MDALQLLRLQHRDIEDLFERAGEAGEAYQQEHLLLQLADALETHDWIEDHLFYPAVHTDTTATLLAEARHEHNVARQILSQVLALASGDARRPRRLRELAAEVAGHIEREEEQLFPRVGRLLGPGELATLGAAMSDAIEQLGPGATYAAERGAQP